MKSFDFRRYALNVLAFLGLIVAAGCSSSGSTPAVLTRALPQSGSLLRQETTSPVRTSNNHPIIQ